jgi:hypothetical protein
MAPSGLRPISGAPISGAPISGAPISGAPISGAPNPISGAPVAYPPVAALPFPPPPKLIEPTLRELPSADPQSPAGPYPGPPPRRTGGRIVLTFLLALLILAGAGVSGYLWWDRAQRRDFSSSGGTDTRLGVQPPDPVLAELQTFAGKQPLDGCVPGTPNEKQRARRGCVIGDTKVTYVLYKDSGRRDAERSLVQSLHRTSKCDCLSQTGISPDKRRGKYIEYTYQAAEDDKWYAALWWDDGESRPGGAGVLTMRTPWDQKSPDPAQALRGKLLSWGYRLDD